MKILLVIESPIFCISHITVIVTAVLSELTLPSNSTSSSVPQYLIDPTFLEGLNGCVMSYGQCLFMIGNTNKLYNVLPPIFLLGHRFGCYV